MNTSIIDYTYFDGPLILPGLSAAEERAKVERMIDYFQPHYLIGVLGFTLGSRFIKALELQSTSAGGGFAPGFDSGFETGTVTPDMARYSFILDGISYPYNGGIIRWNGLRSALKHSPLANFVYYQIKLNDFTQSTQSGEVVSVNEKAIRANASPKMIRAWNEHAEQNRILFGMVSTLHLPMTPGGPPEKVYTELMPDECNASMFTKINDFGI